MRSAAAIHREQNAPSILGDFAEWLAILPIANHENNQHSENENIRVGDLHYGPEVMAALLGGASV